MKTTFLAFLTASCLFLHACEKSGDTESSHLIGKWKLLDTYLSIGGPLIYTEVDRAAEKFLEFKDGGTLSDTDNQYKSFEVIDSAQVTFIKKDKTPQKYFYSINNDTLSLSPADGPICIEGCGSRYTKAEN